MPITPQKLAQLSVVELKKELNQTLSKLLTLRFQIAIGSSTKYNEIKQYKKTIAQIFTFLKQRK